MKSKIIPDRLVFTLKKLKTKQKTKGFPFVTVDYN